MPRVPGLERLRVRVLAAGAVRGRVLAAGAVRGRVLAAGTMRVRVVAIAVLALAGAGIALTLKPSTALNTFVSSSSRDYTATQAMYRQFGSDPVVVLVRGPLTGLLSQANIRTLSRLEACLGGQQLRLDTRLEAYVPVAATKASPYGGADSPCATLMHERAAEVVYGPATFLNRAVAAVNTEVGSLTVNAVETIRAAEAAARTLARSRKLDATQTSAAVQAAGTLALERELASTGATTGSANTTGAGTQALLAGIPSIQDPTFLRQIVFGSATDTSKPSSHFSYLFPSDDAAVIQIRLRAGLDSRQQQQAIDLIRAAVKRPEFQIAGVGYTVTGEPVLLSDLGGEIGGQLILLLAVAIVVMALVLLAVFRRTLRLLPLMTALAAVAITFGLTAVFGGVLTVADVAVFPVLLGLAVDYGVQLRSGTPRGATAVAALATAAGFLALLVSSVPMVRGFGLLLVVGVLIAFSIAAFAIPDRPARQLSPSRLIPRTLLASVYGAGEILSGWLPALIRHPRRVLSLALVLALAGWALDAHTPVQSDITKLVPANMPALRHLDTLERTTGTSGEVRRAGGRAQRDLSQGGQLDGRLRTPDGDALRRGAFGRLRDSDALPGPLTAEPAPDRRRIARSCSRVLPAFRAHTQPPLRAAVVRHPPDAAQPPAAGDRKHARSTEPAAGHPCTACRSPGARRRRRGLARLRQQPHADARAQPLSRRAGAAGHAETRAPRTRAADPDRARDGMVSAPGLPVAHPPEPDVRDPRHAGDRDHDRIQRALVGARLPPARDRDDTATGGRRRLSQHGHRRADLGAHGDRGLRGAHRLEHHDAA